MNKAEPLCDFRFVKAEYRLARPTDEAPENFFDISIRPMGGGKQTFSMAEKNGEQFADRICTRAAIILGAAAPVPHRAKAAENILIGRRVNDAAAGEAAQAALEGPTPLTKNAYKLPLFKTLVRRAVLTAAIDT